MTELVTVNRDCIQYSNKYYDDEYEYRHVTLPIQLVAGMPNRLLQEHEWRSLGIQQSRGWEHYGYCSSDRTVLLFRRMVLNFDNDPA